MHFLLISLLAFTPLQAFALRSGPHQLRDLYSYPRYQVQFLNDLPLSDSDAKRAVVSGVGSEDEWLHPRVGRGLGDGNEKSEKDMLELVPMKFSPNDHDPDSPPYDYLCLMPSSNQTQSQIAIIDQLEEVEDELDPAQGWQALSHLQGKCLYSRQGWFTYAYCHDSYIRQFRAAAHPHPHPSQGYVPQEDPDYDGYTLGRAHPVRSGKSKTRGGKPGSPVHNKDGKSTAVDTISGQTSPAVSFGLGTSSRYLVQHWTDGTKCDKTGRPRTIEVQVHCSMNSGDMIWMIKELAICQYVMIIHSPHLCDLPGFKSKEIDVEGAGIACRQVIDDEEWNKWEKEGSKERKDEDERGKRLELPFTSKPGVDQPQFRFGLPAGDQNAQEKKVNSVKSKKAASEVVFGIDVNEDLKRMLRRALGLLSKDDVDSDGDGAVGDDDEGEGEEIVLISWDEDDDGEAILVGADMIVSDGHGEKKLELAEGEKEALEQVLRDYLNQPDDEKEVESVVGRPADEL